MNISSSSSSSVIANWILYIQAVMFAVLYAVWALPETILIRHICLITGALFGLYEIFQFRDLLFRKLNSANLAVWMLAGLCAWASLHLIFLSTDFSLQVEEFSSIWKRTALGAIFALGLGFALSSQSPQKQKYYWPLFYLGLLAPTLIYLLKYFLTYYGQRWGVNAPEYLKLHYGPLPFYLPKTAYVCFCLPTLAVALGQLKLNIGRHVWLCWGNLIYGLTIPAVFFVFYGENIKNGVMYGALLVLIFAIQLFLLDFKKHWIKKTLLAIVLMVAGVSFITNHIQKNESWRTLTSDAKIALDTQRYDQWKFNGAKGYPNNDLGKTVSITNYERIAWGRVGVDLLAANPLGYGLIERSFGHLSKQVWPESSLHQSHSGWLDLALGVGLPGITLLLGALLLSMRQLTQASARLHMAISSSFFQLRWISACWWILLASLVMWCTTEISQKVFFDSLIFWIAMGAGLSAGALYRRAEPKLTA